LSGYLWRRPFERSPIAKDQIPASATLSSVSI
jgi:hypothetical protein